MATKFNSERMRKLRTIMNDPVDRAKGEAGKEYAEKAPAAAKRKSGAQATGKFKRYWDSLPEKAQQQMQKKADRRAQNAMDSHTEGWYRENYMSPDNYGKYQDQVYGRRNKKSTTDSRNGSGSRRR